MSVTLESISMGNILQQDRYIEHWYRGDEEEIVYNPETGLSRAVRIMANWGRKILTSHNDE